MTHVTCRLTAKNRDQLRNPTLGNRVWASFLSIPKLSHSREYSVADSRPMSTRLHAAAAGAPRVVAGAEAAGDVVVVGSLRHARRQAAGRLLSHLPDRRLPAV